ncbi:MAG: hypothetical protein ABSG93_02070 [Solirubrobacteraceae bacterium]|jgi:hypothetical protein
MSSLATYSDQATRRLAAQRVRTAGRSRRADAGTVTEMARLLLRDAREAHTAEARPRQGAAARAERAVRHELAGASGRLSSRPFAARRA